MRVFFAVELPEALRRTLADGLAKLRRVLPPARWVRPEGLHVTLKFLGEQQSEVVEELRREAALALRQVQPVTVALAGGGFFPSPRRPRVAWVGGTAEGMEEWAERLEACARRHGVPAEERGFSLHLTLARLDRPWGSDAVERFLAEVASWRLPPFEAREVVLFRSELGAGGARYQALARLAVGIADGGDCRA
ncbi:MAG: RNA 2',3'-cyclic phosphodiesterase [Acidobacteriota bacterium]|jgi:2'-5' RNA ligase